MPFFRLISTLLLLILNGSVVAQIHDTLATDKARILAGMEPVSHFRDLAGRAAFQTHRQEIKKGWSYVKNNDIDAIRAWRATNEVLKGTTQDVLFYPFSGPDFLYADAFFPDRSHYIMGGLEDCGTLPRLNTLSEATFSDYLYSLRHSFRYMNKVGYFVTKHMLEDFKTGHLNGAVHIIAYYLVRTKHLIRKIRYFHLNSAGQKVYHDPAQNDYYKILGLEISFIKQGKHKGKTLDYFSMDLSNENLSLNPAFFTYLTGMGKFATFLKSSSYLLHNGEFSAVRDTLLSQSNLILQDATGVPYKILKRQTNKTIRLYGSYTKPIKDFDYRYQPALKTDIEQEKAESLGFRIGYGSWNNETVLILAFPGKSGKPKVAQNNEPEIRKPEQEVEPEAKAEEKVVFKVQFFMSQYRIAPGSTKFKGVQEIDYYTQGNAFKYTSGGFKSYSACRRHLQEVKSKGFEGAFVVAFVKGSRIPVEKAMHMTQEK